MVEYTQKEEDAVGTSSAESESIRAVSEEELASTVSASYLPETPERGGGPVA